MPKSCFSILVSVTPGVYNWVRCSRLNEDLVKIQEWLYCNKLALNVSKTLCVIFTTMQQNVSDVIIMIQKEQNERMYVTNFLGMEINAQLNGKRRIEYTCKQLWKGICIHAKSRKNVILFMSY